MNQAVDPVQKNRYRENLASHLVGLIEAYCSGASERHDGLGLLKLLVTAVIPHALWLLFNSRNLKKSTKNNIYLECHVTTCRLIICGVMLDPVSPEIRSMMRQAALQTTGVELALPMQNI